MAGQRRRASVEHKPSPNGPVSARRLADTEAWSTAVSLADGDVSRLEVLDNGRTVLVRNTPTRP